MLSLLVYACGAESPPSTAADEARQDQFRQWRLPGRLREISGLALTLDERLFAVTDERAVVYELDYSEGKIVKSFALGDPVVRGDFEGIAVLGPNVWLMTSRGDLFVTSEGPDRGNMQYRKYETGLGDYCELEGLAENRAAKTLILACKETNEKKNELMIFELAVAQGDIEELRRVTIPEKEIKDRINEKELNPSGIAIDPQTGESVLIAARQDALVRLTADGGLTDAIILAKKGRHGQAEGIAITRDGRMLIADEGGDGRARLAVYPAGSQGTKKSDQ